MALTTKWSLEKPVRGTLLWDTPLNSNFDKIDTFLYKLRTNYAGNTAPTENADTGSTWFDAVNSMLKLKLSGSYQELLTKVRGDALYAAINHSHLYAEFYWTDVVTGNLARIYFNSSKQLEIDFGNTPGYDKIIYKWIGTDGSYEVLNIYSNKITFKKPVEILTAPVSGIHALNMSAGDSRYLKQSSYTAVDVFNKVKTLDGLGSGLDADLLQSYSLKQLIGTKTATNIVNGILIATDIPASTATYERFILKILGNTNTDNVPMDLLANGYISSDIASFKALVSGKVPPLITAFCYNTYLHFWIQKPSTNNYHFYIAEVYAGNDTVAKNRITSITDAAFPSSGTSKSTNCTISKNWNQLNDGAGSGLDAELFGGYNSSAYLKTADLLTSIKDIDGSGTGIDSDTIDGKHYSDITTAINSAINSALAGIQITPTGTIHTYAGDIGILPTGYLECDGQAVSRSTYSNLFSIIGTVYGSGNGSTTFNLPDLRGMFIRGLDLGRKIDSDRTLGSVQSDSLKAHQHYTFSSTPNATLEPSATYPAGYHSNTEEDEEYSINSINSTANVCPTSSTGSTETRPTNIAMRYIIKY